MSHHSRTSTQPSLIITELSKLSSLTPELGLLPPANLILPLAAFAPDPLRHTHARGCRHDTLCPPAKAFQTLTWSCRTTRWSWRDLSTP